VDELARQLQQLGHTVVLLCPEQPPALKAFDQDYPYRILRHPRFFSQRWFINRRVGILKRLYHEFRYDVIHCHNVYPAGYLAVRHKLEGGPPVVITSHGGDVRSNNPRFQKRSVRAKHSFAVKQANALISIGPFTEQGYLELGGTTPFIHAITNGVHAEQLSLPVARPDTIPEYLAPKNYILFVGRLAYRKGVDILLKAAAIQSNASSHMPHVVIAGDGDQRASLESLSVALGLQQRVTFLGMVYGPIKQWLLQNALTLVIPSRQWEAYPMVLLEGYAAGCSVVASDVPGLNILVDHNKTGWLVPHEHPVALAERLTTLWQNPVMTQTVAEQSQHIARRCDWKRVAEQHVLLYQSVTRLR